MIDVGDRDLGDGLALVLAADRLLGRRAGARRGARRGRAARRGAAGRTRARAAAAARRTRRGARAASGGAAPVARARRCARRSASAARRAARATRISSASRRRFSTRASFSMLGQAHSSPMVSGATRWKLSRNRAELLPVEPAVAVADELDRQRVDARVPACSREASLGQLAVVAARQVLADLSPISAATRWKLSSSHSPAGVTNVAAVDVVGEGAVGVARATRALSSKRGKTRRARAAGRVDREAGGERARALLEPLDARAARRGTASRCGAARTPCASGTVRDDSCQVHALPTGSARHRRSRAPGGARGGMRIEGMRGLTWSRLLDPTGVRALRQGGASPPFAPPRGRYLSKRRTTWPVFAG